MTSRNRARFRLGLTESGRVLLRGTVFIFLAALIVPAFGVLSALIAALLTGLAAGFILRPRIRVESDVPDSVITGQAVRLRYVLENASRFPVYSLSVEPGDLPDGVELTESPPVVPRLGPGERTEVIFVVQPHRRGYYRLSSPRCRSGFPFDLFWFGTSGNEELALEVLPQYSSMSLMLQSLHQRVENTGSTLSGRTEISPEYVGNRPFLPGDSPRRIDARAWARLSVPATKEYFDNYGSSAMLILDTYVPRGLRARDSSPIPAFEAAICACASAAFTLDRECLIDHVFIGSALHSFTESSRIGRFETIHHMLARVEPSDECSLDRILPILDAQLHRTSELVLVVTMWNEACMELTERAARAGCHTTVVWSGEPVLSVRGGSDDLLFHGSDLIVLSPDDVLCGRMDDL